MKSTLFFAIPLLLLTTGVNGQEKVFTIKAGEVVNEVVPVAEIFSYAAFKPGLVYFKSGDVSQGILNYNALNGSMDFINLSGDTLALAEEPLINMIVIDKDTFMYDRGFIKMIKASGNFRLGKKEAFSLAKLEKTGAFDQTMPVAMETYSSISNGSRLNNLVIRENMTLVKNTAYFFGNKNGDYQPAGKKGLQKLFSKQSRQINDYLATNDPDFSNEEDLKKIIQFLQEL